jgi:hypothetical protein
VRRLPGEIVLNVALLRFRAISQLILAQNIFLSISLRRSFRKRLFCLLRFAYNRSRPPGQLPEPMVLCSG